MKVSEGVQPGTPEYIYQWFEFVGYVSCHKAYRCTNCFSLVLEADRIPHYSYHEDNLPL